MLKRKIKPVFNQNIHFTFRGLIRNIFIITSYCIAIFVYYVILQTISYFQYGNKVSFILSPGFMTLFFFLFIYSPIIALMHVIYLDTGNLILKAMVWLQTFLSLIMIPILIFLF